MSVDLKVLVTGCQGQVARALREAGVRAGVTVSCASRPELDLCDQSSVLAAIAREQPGVVVNAAAYTMVDKAESEPDIARSVNARGAGHVAVACAKAGIPLIHISTDYVFDGTGTGFYREDDPVRPVSVYGATKLEGERLVAAGCARHIIIRTAWVHSPWGHNFVKTMLRLAQTRPELRVVDDQMGSPTYAPDLALALLGIARRITEVTWAGSWGVYHAVNRGEATWYGFAREVFELARKHGLPAAHVTAIATAEYPTPARRPMNSRLGCTKLERVFGLTLPHWRDGAASCVARLAQAVETG